MKTLSTFSSILATVLLFPTGCVRFPAARESARAERPKAFDKFRYEKPRELVSLDIPMEQTKWHEHHRVYLRRATGGALRNIELELDYFKPVPRQKSSAEKRWGTIVLLPASAGGYDVYALLASSFTDEFAVVVPRRVEIPKLLKDNMDGETLDTLFRDSIIDAEQVLDWILSRPELDPSRIGILGISMGAMRGAVLAGIDPRVKASVLVLGGADLPDIIAHSRDGASKDRGISKRRKLHRLAHGCRV